MSKYIWQEDGWYDCCGGLWFVHYKLTDEDGDTPVQADDEDSVLLYSLVLNKLGVESFDNKTVGIVDSVVELMVELGTFVNDECLEEYGIEVVIIRDESIDYSITHTCMD